MIVADLQDAIVGTWILLMAATIIGCVIISATNRLKQFFRNIEQGGSRNSLVDVTLQEMESDKKLKMKVGEKTARNGG